MLYLNCIKHFSVRRVVFSVFFSCIFLFTTCFAFFFRLVDEIVFYGYRKTKIEKPIFIISNPRSGTTYLHRLLCMNNQFVYTLLYHTILPSITLLKIIQILGKVDMRIGSPIQHFFDWFDRLVFGGWDNIHTSGVNKSEEDETIFVYTTLTPSSCMFSPYMQDLQELFFLDYMPAKKRKRVMSFYKNTLQRFMYVFGEDYTMLSKNVFSSGRLQSILETFPDARIIYLIRHPYQSVPSMVSMFTTPWRTHSKDIPANSENYRAWGDLAIRFYDYFDEQKKVIDKKNLLILKYQDLIEHPKETILRIHNYYHISVSEELSNRLSQIAKRNINYKSKHSYSLEKYGIDKAYIYGRIPHIFDTFGFKR